MAKTAKQVIPQEISNEVIGALADALERSSQSIRRMIIGEDIRLTTTAAIGVFQRYGIKWPEIMQGSKAVA